MDEQSGKTAGDWTTARGRAGEETTGEMTHAGECDDAMETAKTVRPGGGPLLAGRYRVLRKLGEGGMGSVWLAEDGKLDNRPVAVKMLPAVLAGKPAFFRQVKDEALTAMKLSHSHIATVRAFEEDESGNPFLVMDYVEGRGLDEILAEKGRLPPEEAVRLLSPVAAALDYAHSQGVVHRDVKPGNVIVRTDGTPFVLDFGIASEIRETMTRVTGKSIGGTLLYMSPEQLNGDAPKASHDVYSFAAMAYECLTGHPPFFRGGIEDQIKHKTPDPLPPDVPAALRAGIMSGLAKEAAGRPATCAEVLSGKEAAAGKPGAKTSEPPRRKVAIPELNTFWTRHAHGAAIPVCAALFACGWTLMLYGWYGKMFYGKYDADLFRGQAVAALLTLSFFAAAFLGAKGLWHLFKIRWSHPVMRTVAAFAIAFATCGIAAALEHEVPLFVAQVEEGARFVRLKDVLDSGYGPMWGTKIYLAVFSAEILFACAWKLLGKWKSTSERWVFAVVAGAFAGWFFWFVMRWGDAM